MQWLREHGVISNYDDYAELPLVVVEDARLLMEAEAREHKRQAEINRQGGARRGKRR